MKNKKTITVFIFICTYIFNLQANQATDSLTQQTDTIRKLTLKQVEVLARSSNVTGGILEIDVNELKKLPRLIGENDPFKALQYMNGISIPKEGSSEISVRGGGSDQNLILLNGSSVQNPTHVLGLFSVFNGDIIENLRFIKYGMPAEYGGRLSSIMEFNTFNSVPEKFKIDGSIGLISSRIAGHIPIGKKLSVFGSARTSYLGAIILPGLAKAGIMMFEQENRYDFNDLNAGFVFQLSPLTKITGHIYSGNDFLKTHNINNTYSGKNKINWNNTASGIQLNHIFNAQWSMNHQINYSSSTLTASSLWLVSYMNVKSTFKTFNYKPSALVVWDNHNLKFGADVSFQKSLPYLTETDTALHILNLKNEHNNFHSAQLTAFIQDEFTWNRLLFNFGLRGNLYKQIGPYTDYYLKPAITYADNKTIKSYPSLEPRLYMRYLINKTSSFKLGATYHTQYYNQIPVISFGLLADLQIPASIHIKPQSSINIGGGYFRNYANDMFETSIELYYKTINNQLEFNNDIIQAINNGQIEKYLTHGKGWAYGGEFKFQKNGEKLSGWISYNLSWSFRQFDEINNGERFLDRNDRRHNLSLVTNFKLNNRWNFSGVFVFATGSRFNLPVSWFNIEDKLILEYGKYNSFKLPDYHRLDLSATYHLKPILKSLKSELNFSIYNVYCRYNPYEVFFSGKSMEKHQFRIGMSFLLPIIPSVSWVFHL